MGRTVINPEATEVSDEECQWLYGIRQDSNVDSEESIDIQSESLNSKMLRSNTNA